MKFLQNEKIKTIIVVCIFITVWIWNVAFAAKYGEAYLDSDMASEMVLANKTNEAGVYLDTGWLYSTEIRILGQIMLFKPLLLLFPNNWGLVRVVAQAIFLLATGLSYIYMTSILGNIRKSIFFAAILLCPFGFWHMWHGCFGGQYLIWIGFYSLLAGLILRLSIRKGGHEWLQWPALVILSFLCGLQSIRVFNNLLIPIVIAALIMTYSGLKETGGKVCFQKLRFLVIAVVSCLFAGTGYLINHFILQNIYAYANQDEKQWQEFSISRVISVFEDFIQLFGYPYNFTQTMEIPLFSLAGLLSCFGILLIIVFIAGFVVSLRKYKILGNEEKTIVWTSIMAFFVPTMIFAFFLTSSNGSYFLPSFGLYVATLQIAVDRFSYVYKKIGKVFLSAVILIITFLSGISTQMLFLKYPPRSHPEMVKVAETLKEQGYTQAISIFWLGNVLTELSDGYIEVWVTTYDMNLDYMIPQLQAKSHLTDKPQGKYAYVFETYVFNNTESQYSLLEDNDNAYLVYQDYLITVVGIEE